MSKKIAAAFAAALALALFAPAAQAQKALVYCPVGVDATGCDRIVAALQPKFPDGVDRGYDGTNSTVDLMKVDLEHYAVIVVPSLADDDTKQPYSVLRKAAARLHLAVNGRVAVYSGAPDQGSANRADKDAIIQNLASWSAKGHTRATGLVGLVAFLDLSENTSARYSWVKSVSLADVSADAETQSIADLTPAGRGGDLLANAGQAIHFSNMASYGLNIGARAAARTEVGAMSTTTDSHQSVLVTYANADGKDLGTNGGRPGGASLDVSSGGGGAGPTLTTDKPDYLPGDTVLFSGTGWAPNDTVTITVHEDPQWSNPDRTVTAVADGNGNLTSHDFVVQQRDFGVTFTATAVGNPSGLVAQVTFTDAGSPSLAISKTPNGSFPSGGTGSFTLQVENGGPGATDGTTITVRDTLQTGFTFTSGFGTGWICSSQLLGNPAKIVVTCTSSQTVARKTQGNNPTPATPITLRVGVTASAGTVVTNEAWVTGGGDASNNPSTVASVTIAAPATFNLTVAGTGAGTGTVTSQPSGMNCTVTAGVTSGTCLFAFNSGSNITLTATPSATSPTAAGSTFAAWSGDGTGTTTRSVTIDANHAISAQFKANQTITFAAPAGKTYGDADFDPAATASSGLAVTYVSTTAVCTVVSGKLHIMTAGSCSVTASQAGDATNYNAAPDVPRTFTIAQKTVTVATLSANNKTYDGNNTATLTGGTLSGVVAGDEANVSLDISTATATFSDALAGTNKLVTANGLGLSGGAKGNYILSSTTATTHANIDQKSLTASITATGKEYDGTTTVTGTVNCTVATKVVTDDVGCTTSGAVFDSPNAGSRTITANVALSGTAAGNYKLDPQTTASTSATITQKALTIKADDKEKNYDGLAFSPFTASYTGLIAADADAGPQPKTGVLSTPVTFGGNAAGAVNAGSYVITPSGATATNYAIGFGSGTLKIDRVNATLNTTGFSGPYDGQTHPGSCSATGVNNANVPTTSTYTPGPAVPVNAGSYTLACAVSGQQNYNDASVNKDITITKVALTVKADDQSKTYDGATFSPYTSKITGFVNSETGAVVSGAATYTGAATAAVNAGTYAITPVVTGLSATNYTFTPVDGSLLIKQASLTITAADKEKTYDALPFSPFTVSYAGLVASDADAGPQPKAGVLSTPVTFGGNAVGAVNAGSYTISPSGATATNYAISFGNGTLKIDKANATISAAGFSGPYDGQPHPGSCSATGVNNTGVPTTTTYTPGPAAPVNAGSYTLACVVSGQQNYNDASANKYITISKVALTVKADDQMKTYDGGTFSPFTSNITGFVNNETSAGVVSGSVTYTGAAVTAVNAGTYAITPVVAALSATNYTFSPMDGSLLIKQKPLSITADDKEKTYDALPFSPFTASYVGLIAADADVGPQPKAGVLSTPVTFGGNAPGAVNAGSYTITPSGATATNYAINFGNGTLKIDKANATISAAGFSGPYDGQPHPGSCSAIGVNNSSVPTTTAYTPGPGAPVNAGSSTLTCAVSGQQNYNDASVNKYITITKVALTVKADDKNKTYDGTAFAAFTSNITGFVNNEGNGVVSGSVTYTGAATTAINASTYAITPVVAGLSATNYTFTPADGSLLIKQAALSIKADDEEKTYDALPFSPFTASYTGLIAADADAGPQPRAGVLSGPVTFGGTAAGASDAGTYNITPQGVTATNYAISFFGGTLKIDKANATINAVGFSGPYDGQPHPGSCSATGVNNTNVPTTPTYTPGPAAPVNAGSYTLICAVSGQQNYNDAVVNKYITITKVALTVKADYQSKTYDGATFSAFTSKITGFVNNEGSGVVSGTVTYTGAATTAINAGTYAITPVVTGLSATNYTFTPSNGSLVIKQQPASVTPNAASKAYGDPDPTPLTTGTLSGFLAVDNVTATYSRSPTGDTPTTYTISASLSATGLLTNYIITLNTAVFTITNDTPVINSLTGPPGPVALGSPVTVTGTFADHGFAGDAYVISSTWMSGANSVAVPNVGAGSYNGNSGTLSITAPSGIPTGVYTVTVIVTDKWQAASSPVSVSGYVVVYDPNGGFVTGGGWINSPAGAYAADLSLAGKATFGFVSKYKKGQSTPDGDTEFQFHEGNLNFKSTSYDWLVLAGTKAQYKGSGTINGSGDYFFMLTATDGDLKGKGSPDTFRIKIWDKVTLAVIYDNMVIAAQTADSADPTTTLGGGSIQIHQSP